MRKSLVNKLLIAIACWDGLLMVTNLLYGTVADHVPCGPFKYSYAWKLYVAFYANISPIAHTSSLWLTVLIGVVRYKNFLLKSLAHSVSACVHGYGPKSQ